MSKRQFLEKAKGLLAQKDDGLLPYACLELRYCVEAIVYEKLASYSKYIPSSVYAKWQPQHALAALLQFEPGADSDLIIEIGEEKQYGEPAEAFVPLGEHKTVKLKWLQKHYHKLGSFLHVSRSVRVGAEEGSSEPEKVRLYLESTIAELAEVVNCTVLGFSLAERIEFQCSVCGETSFANVEGAKRSGRVACVRPNCGAEYVTRENESGALQAHLHTSSFKCQNCGENNAVENRRLKIGHEFSCEQCQAKHEIVSRHWGYKVAVHPLSI